MSKVTKLSKAPAPNKKLYVLLDADDIWKAFYSMASLYYWSGCGKEIVNKRDSYFIWCFVEAKTFRRLHSIHQMFRVETMFRQIWLSKSFHGIVRRTYGSNIKIFSSSVL